MTDEFGEFINEDNILTKYCKQEMKYVTRNLEDNTFKIL